MVIPEARELLWYDIHIISFKFGELGKLPPALCRLWLLQWSPLCPFRGEWRGRWCEGRGPEIQDGRVGQNKGGGLQLIVRVGGGIFWWSRSSSLTFLSNPRAKRVVPRSGCARVPGLFIDLFKYPYGGTSADRCKIPQFCEESSKTVPR